jgi:hypothetical protein
MCVLVSGTAFVPNFSSRARASSLVRPFCRPTSMELADLQSLLADEQHCAEFSPTSSASVASALSAALCPFHRGEITSVCPAAQSHQLSAGKAANITSRVEPQEPRSAPPTVTVMAAGAEQKDKHNDDQ